MRGKVLPAAAALTVSGITPAYAGKSQPGTVIDVQCEDHPRLCGEKFFSAAWDTIKGGITPAYAGKRFPEPVHRSAAEDHPRLCGEKGRCVRHPFQFGGSPPPMRGKVIVRVVGISSRGITPAYAGKSIRPQPSKFLLRDHPRLCGEK